MKLQFSKYYSFYNILSSSLVRSAGFNNVSSSRPPDTYSFHRAHSAIDETVLSSTLELFVFKCVNSTQY